MPLLPAVVPAATWPRMAAQDQIRLSRTIGKEIVQAWSQGHFSPGVGWWDCLSSSPVTRQPLLFCPPPSEAHRIFKASPRAWQAKTSSVPTPPPIQISNLVSQEVSSECTPALSQAILPGVGGRSRGASTLGLELPQALPHSGPSLPTRPSPGRAPPRTAASTPPPRAARTCQRYPCPTEVGMPTLPPSAWHLPHCSDLPAWSPLMLPSAHCTCMLGAGTCRIGHLLWHTGAIRHGLWHHLSLSSVTIVSR